MIAALALMEHLSRWLVAQGLGLGGLTVAEVERFVRDRRRSGPARRPSPKGLTPLLGYLRGLGVAPEPAPVVTGDRLEQLLAEFAGFLTNERGLALGTVCYYRTTAKRFLLTCFSQREIDSVDFGCVTAGEVRSFIVGEAGRRSIGSVKNVVTAWRALLRFLHVRGYVAISLADAVPAVAGWRGGLFPQVLQAGEVAGLLDSCDRRTVGGRRDYAILVLLARLGLRAGEVAALTVDDIDWRAGEILVCGKGNRYARLPVPADVGQAVADYCRWGRRRAGCRSVFLHIRAPYTALSGSAIGKIVERACDRAGLPQDGCASAPSCGGHGPASGRRPAVGDQANPSARPSGGHRRLRHDRGTGIGCRGPALAGRCAMSTLREVVQEYVTLGFKLVEHDRLLAHFVDYLDQTRTPTITIEAALAWATQPTTAQPARWKARLCVVRGFARHLHVVDPRVEVPPVDLLPCRYQRPTPSLFSPEDIAALLAATHHIKSPLRAATFGALFGLLATTGMRVGEAIRLDDADVDLTVGLLTVRQTKFSKSRQVPVHTTTVAALGRYAHTRAAVLSTTDAEFLRFHGWHETRLQRCRGHVPQIGDDSRDQARIRDHTED